MDSMFPLILSLIRYYQNVVITIWKIEVERKRRRARASRARRAGSAEVVTTSVTSKSLRTYHVPYDYLYPFRILNPQSQCPIYELVNKREIKIFSSLDYKRPKDA